MEGYGGAILIMYEVCGYYVSSVLRKTFNTISSALNYASELCNDGKSISVEIKDTQKNEMLYEFIPDRK